MARTSKKTKASIIVAFLLNFDKKKKEKNIKENGVKIGH